MNVKSKRQNLISQFDRATEDHNTVETLEIESCLFLLKFITS